MLGTFNGAMRIWGPECTAITMKLTKYGDRSPYDSVKAAMGLV
jgi:hypothetical protein